MSSDKLKGLETKRNTLDTEIEAIYQERVRLTKREQQLGSERAVVINQIKQLKDRNIDPIVSEHALLRYIERVIGIDMDELRQKILTEEVKNFSRIFGDGTFPAEGFKVVVKDKKVVTIKV